MQHIRFTRDQKKAMAEQISLGLDRTFPRQGGQQKLAAMLGVTPAAITHWKKGRKAPSIEHLVRLSEVFGIRIHVLCGFKGDRKIQSGNPLFQCIINLSIMEARLEKHKAKMSPTLNDALNTINALLDDLLKKAR